jgi:ADP-ribose pyrophosphatase
MSYRLLDEKTLHNGKKVRFALQHWINDQTGRQVEREVCVHPGAVVVLPLRPDGSVVLIRNNRHAIGQVLLELPAGTLEKDEDPAKCAARELLEETGYRAGRIEPLATFYTSPGVLTEKMYAFVAYDLTKEETALEEGEEIELAPAPMSQAIAMCSDGRIMDGKTIASLLMFDRKVAKAAALGGVRKD